MSEVAELHLPHSESSGQTTQGYFDTANKIAKALDTDINNGVFNMFYPSYKILRWAGEQPKKMTELQRLVERQHADIVMFLDTAARPTGRLYHMVRNQLGYSEPKVEFIAPPERETILYREAEYRSGMMALIEKRFSHPHYADKNILLVDESTATGAQLDFIKRMAEYMNRHVTTVSLGSDNALTSDQVRKIDYIMGKAVLPPWSKHVNAITSSVTGVSKLSAEEVSDKMREGDNSSSLATVKNNPKRFKDNDGPRLNKDLQRLAHYCVDYYQRIGDHQVVPYRNSQGEGHLLYDLNNPEERAALIDEIVAAIDQKKTTFGEPLNTIFEYLQPRSQLRELLLVVSELSEEIEEPLHTWARQARLIKYLIEKEAERTVIRG